MAKLGRPPHIPTPREEAKWAAWNHKCMMTRNANALLKMRNQAIFYMREDGEKWEVIASTFEISPSRAWQIWNSIKEAKQKGA